MEPEKTQIRFILDSIPWFRQKGRSPVYPILDDTLGIFVDQLDKVISFIFKNSNECSILNEYPGWFEELLCDEGHFWCRSPDERPPKSVIYGGSASYDNAYEICSKKGLVLATPTAEQVIKAIESQMKKNPVFTCWTNWKRINLTHWADGNTKVEHLQGMGFLSV